MDKKDAVRFLLRTLRMESGEFMEYINSISSVVEKKKKEILFLESEEGTNLYFLLSGSVKLYKTSEDGKEAVIHFVEPGEFFAEIVLFLENRYPVSAMTISDSQLLSIDAGKMFSAISKNPEFAMKLIGIFAQRLNYMADVIKNLSIMDTKDKFLNYLRRVKDENGVVTLNIPKQEIALLLGIAPETFSRVLKQLSEQNIVEIKGKTIKLLS